MFEPHLLFALPLLLLLLRRLGLCLFIPLPLFAVTELSGQLLVAVDERDAVSSVVASAQDPWSQEGLGG